MFSPLARVLAVVLVAGTTAACAVSSDGGDVADSSSDAVSAPPPAAVSSAAPVAAPNRLGDEPAGPEALISNMAESLLESLLGHAVDGLFPSPTIDYDRLAQDFTKAAHQAAVDQTVWAQKGLIQGKLDTLNDIEVRYQHSTRGQADALDAYQSIDTQWEDINGSIETLNQPELANVTLGAWVSAAQIKMNMIGELVMLDPDRADGNRALLYSNAKQFYAHLSSTKMALLQTAMKNRVGQISPHCEEHYFSGGAGPRYVYSDNGKIMQMFGDPERDALHHGDREAEGRERRPYLHLAPAEAMAREEDPGRKQAELSEICEEHDGGEPHQHRVLGEPPATGPAMNPRARASPGG